MKKSKKKMEFSKKVCIFGIILVVMAWAGNFILLWFDKQSMSDVTMTMITMFGGFATGGYYGLCGFRNNSLNKYAEKIEYKYDANG